MRTARLILAAALLVGAAPSAYAAHPDKAEGSERPGTVRLVRDLWGLVSTVSELSRPEVSALVEQLQAERAARGDRPSAAGVQERDDRRTHLPRAVLPADSGGRVVDLSDLSRPTELEPKLRALAEEVAADADARVTVSDGAARLGDYSVGSDETVTGHLLVLEGNADVYGKLVGNLVTVDGDVIVHPGAVVSGDILAIDGSVLAEGAEVGGEVRVFRQPAVAARGAAAESALTPLQTVLRNTAGVLGVFVTLGALGFGIVLFGRSNLEIVSDTVSHSFGRAFVTGLLGQVLLLPTFGMLVVGLILSVAGILLIPFAVAVFVLLAVIGIVGGFLAVAHAMGETYTRRRMAAGTLLGSANSYRFVVTGLASIMALWVAWAIFGWVPVAGGLIAGAAGLVTWLLATVGFGAALLSRAGARENFAGRIIPPEALTDEYLWATPQFGVPAVRRPTQHRTPRQGL